jgi:peptidoglycan/xylan/chitin deacetylase (PgdA/CDA1 family)
MPTNADRIAAQLLIRSGLLPVIERHDVALPDVLRIVLYHRVDLPGAQDGVLDPSLLSATPAQFAQQMAFLVEHYHLVAIEELLWAIARERPLPPGSVMVTFDDGYRDFLAGAWPVLERLGVPAVLFVVTRHLAEQSGLFWWDRLYQAVARTRCEELDLGALGRYPLQPPDQRWLAFTRLKATVKALENRRAMALVDQIVERLGVCSDERQTTLTWEELRDLSGRGLTVAPHTRCHPVLSRISPEEARQEIRGSYLDVVEQLGCCWPLFAYPCGHEADICPGLLALLREAGFRAAMTCIAGHNALRRCDPLLLRRVSLAPHLSLDEFRLVLTGVYDMYGALCKLRRRC